MQNLIIILALINAALGAFSVLSLVIPIRPFRSRGQALKGIGASMIVLLVLSFAFSFADGVPTKATGEQTAEIDDGEQAIAQTSPAPSTSPNASPASAKAEDVEEADLGIEAAEVDSVIRSATVAPETIAASCGQGGVAIMDEASVFGSQYLHKSPGGERLTNEKATAALGELTYQSVDYSQILRRLCVMPEWTEVEVMTPDWLQGIEGWIPSEATRVIERDSEGKRIFVESDFFWDQDSSKFKAQIVNVVNRIYRDNSNCEEVDTSTVALSASRSEAGKPIFFVTCERGKYPFNVWFSPNDAESDIELLAVKPISRATAADICEDAAKTAASHPSTVSFSRFKDFAFLDYPSGRARVTSTFSAKNSLGLSLRYRIDCLFDGDNLLETNIAEDSE